MTKQPESFRYEVWATLSGDGRRLEVYRTNYLDRAWWYLDNQQDNPEIESLEIVDLDKLEG